MRLPLTLPLAVGLVLAPAVAFATPTVTVNPTIQRYTQTGGTPAQHAMPAGTQGLNYTDCASNVQISFLLTTMPDPSYSLQAWAGPVDCAPAAAREAASAQCWPVVPGNLVSAVTLNPKINVQDIVSQYGKTSTAINLSYVPATPAVCNTSIAATTDPDAGTSGAGSGAAAITVYFMWVPNAGGDAPVEAPYAFMVKLAGPAAPTGISVSAGDTLLKVSWAPAVDTTIAGFDIFTDPPPSGMAAPIPYDAAPYPVTTCYDAGVDDAGNPIDGGCTTQIVNPVDPNAGSDGGSGTCGSSVLGSGQPASALTQYVAASVGGSTNASYNLTGLTNGNNYNVAVAATDTYDNIGPLSAISTSTCGTPAPINDFWKTCAQDGCGGGSGCALENVGATARAPVFGLAIVGLIGLYWKRRRR